MAFHKRNRLEKYDYCTNGVYFLTLCTEKKKQLLSRIVARGILDAPSEAIPCRFFPQVCAKDVARYGCNTGAGSVC